MQDVALLTGKHGVAYIPIAEARGITPLMISIRGFFQRHIRRKVWKINTDDPHVVPCSILIFN